MSSMYKYDPWLSEFTTETPTRDDSNAADPSSDVGPQCNLTVLTNARGPATKVFSLDAAGRLIKKSAAHIYEGRATCLTIASLSELGTLIAGLESNQALCFGIGSIGDARLVTQEALPTAGPLAIARDRDHFRFVDGGPGILMLDFDSDPDHQPRTQPELDAILAQVVPKWRETERLWRASSSSYLFNADGTELIGAGNWRCYVMVDNASAIPSVGAFIYQRLWDLGYGYVRVTKSGFALDRSLIDASVWQPERIDFAAEPVLESGIIRTAPDPILLSGAPLLGSSQLQPGLSLSEWRRSSEPVRKAKADVRTRCADIREAFVAKHVEAIMTERPDASETQLTEQLTRAAESHLLGPEFVLHPSTGGAVTVDDILREPDRWHGARFADPLEPDYRDDNRVAFANLKPGPGQDPYIWSHAHGGIRYRLSRPMAAITLLKGEQPYNVDKALQVIQAKGDLFERGGKIVRISGAGLQVVEDPWLSDYLGRHITFTRIAANGDEVATDTPTWLCQRIRAKSAESGLRHLNGIITAPMLRPDGSVLDRPGYDADSQVLLLGEKWPNIPETPTPAELRTAFATLWYPFKEFPFESPNDRGVMVACLLTALVRPMLPTAPAFSFDAPAAGTGKTLLAQCVAALCGGVPSVVPQCQGEEEFRKLLLSVLLEGRPSALFDNIRGQFKSASLEACLTSGVYTDRVLGVSQTATLPARLMILITGNNFCPNGDLFRRMLTARINSRTESPERRSFDLNPLAYCTTHRLKLVTAGLTVLRGFISARPPRTTKDRLASFEEWDDLIRQCVLWLAKQNVADLSDPTACIDAAKEREPELEELAMFLEAAEAVTGQKDWQVSNLVKSLDAPPQAPLQQSHLDQLKEILTSIAGDQAGINKKRLGRWIESHDDTRCSGRYLKRAGKKQGAVVWRICRDDTSAGGPGDEQSSCATPMPSSSTTDVASASRFERPGPDSPRWVS